MDDEKFPAGIAILTIVTASIALAIDWIEAQTIRFVGWFLYKLSERDD